MFATVLLVAMLSVLWFYSRGCCDAVILGQVGRLGNHDWRLTVCGVGEGGRAGCQNDRLAGKCVWYGSRRRNVLGCGDVCMLLFCYAMLCCGCCGVVVFCCAVIVVVLSLLCLCSGCYAVVAMLSLLWLCSAVVAVVLSYLGRLVG